MTDIINQFNSLMKDFDKTFAKVEASNDELDAVLDRMREQKAKREDERHE